MTVFITTHYLDEADALCDRIAIMDHGEVVAEGTPAELKREISGDVVHGRARRRRHRRRPRKLLDGEEYVNKLETARRGRAAPLRRRGRHRHPADPAPRRRAPGSTLNSIELHRPSLDDVFLTKTGRSLRES